MKLFEEIEKVTLVYRSALEAGRQQRLNATEAQMKVERERYLKNLDEMNKEMMKARDHEQD
jgi:hypothetical protein